MNWRNVYFTVKKALIASFSLSILFIALNFHIFFTFGQDVIDNGTVITECWAPDEDPGWAFNFWSIVIFFLI